MHFQNDGGVNRDPPHSDYSLTATRILPHRFAESYQNASAKGVVKHIQLAIHFINAVGGRKQTDLNHRRQRVRILHCDRRFVKRSISLFSDYMDNHSEQILKIMRNGEMNRTND